MPKLSEIKPCAVCKGKIVPTWYVLRISQAMLRPSAVNSTMGIAQMFGGIDRPGALAIAEVMSPDPDCIMVLGDLKPELMLEIYVCQNCALMKDVNIAMLMESARQT